MKEIVSFGDYFEWFTILEDNGKFRVRKTKEDEGTTEQDEPRNEVLWLMTWKDFNPSKQEILNIKDALLLDDWLEAVRMHLKG